MFGNNTIAIDSVCENNLNPSPSIIQAIESSDCKSHDHPIQMDLPEFTRREAEEKM